MGRLRLGGRPVYLVSHPDSVKYVLQDQHDRYRKGRQIRRIKPLFGEGLTTSEDGLWRRQRRLMQPVFQHRTVAALTPVITGATAAMLERWRAAADGGHGLAVEAEMIELTRTIMLQALFGSHVEGHADEVRRALAIALEAIDGRIWAWLDLPTWVPTPRNRRLDRARRTLDSLVDRMRAEHPRGMESRDLLSMMVSAREAKTGQPMGESQLRDELLTLLVAGHTTTAATLAWIWYLLSQHPGVARLVETELDAVLGGRPPGDHDLLALPYTRQVIDEALRLYPPTWVTARTPIEADAIGNCPIPRDSLVLLSPYVTHRHPEFWQLPETFDPERFAPSRSVGRPSYAYFPFGGGPRLCIGRSLALLEIHLIVAMVGQAYELRLLPGHWVEPRAGLTLRPRGGLLMTVARRASAREFPR